MRARPLSPHIGIYRWMYTMVLSIAHRITGVAMSIGLLVLTWWLMALAAGPETYGRVTAILSHWIFQLLLAAWLAAFAWHLCTGIRHLVWDTGRGLERVQARASARVAVIAAIVIFVILAWWAFFTPRGVA
ncbi:MAG: succinate dehydrogenase, cytochrome b556 subunit [Gammaproteobacteria bacterium]|nr:succinate dehydrogenase, cytochrome b556 subunit [Gammaproteobacteria bacterium]